MSKKKRILIPILVILILIVIAIGFLFIKNKKDENDKKNYQIEKIEKYNYFLLNSEGKYGVIDDKGNIILNAKYDDVKIPNPSKAVFVCYTEESTSVINEKQEQILSQYNGIEPIKLKNIASDLVYEKNILTYKESDKYGIIDFEGNKLTDAIYDSIESLTYREGELLTKKDDKYGVININGYTIIDNLYDDISSDLIISEKERKELGYIVQNRNSDGIKYGYIDKNGQLKLDLEYNEITRVNDEEQVYIIASKNGKYGFIKNYETVVDFSYQDIEFDVENKILILKKGIKYGVVDLNGNTIIPIENEDIDINGIYIYTQKENSQNVYDMSGKEQEIDFNITVAKTNNPHYYIKTEKQKNRNVYGVIDENGNQIIEDKYLYIEYAYEDYFIVCGENGKLGVIDKDDNVFIELQYDLVQKINNKNIIQTLNVNSKVTSIYSSTMDKVLEIENASIEAKEDYIKVFSKKDTNYLNNNGELISNKDIFDSKLYAKKEKDKWGFEDKDGKLIIDAKYEKVTDFNQYGFASIKQDGKWGVINEDGEIIVEPKYEINADSSEVDFINKYYKKQYGFGEIYYTDNME